MICCRTERRRHIGIEIFDDAKIEACQSRQIAHCQLCLRFCCFLEDRLRPLKKKAPRWRQGQRPRPAIDKIRPKGRLEVTQLLANRRRADIEASGRGRDRAFFRRCREDFDAPKCDLAGCIDHAPPFRRPAGCIAAAELQPGNYLPIFASCSCKSASCFLIS